MPQLDSETRTRDLEQLLADPSIGEEPAPIGVGETLSRFLTQSDVLDLSDEFDVIMLGTRYFAVPRNRLVNGGFGTGDLSGWTSSESSVHTVTISYATDEVDVIQGSNRAAKFYIMTSNGAGSTILYQDIDIDEANPFSGEAWVKIIEKTGGARFRLSAQYLTLSNVVLETHSVDFTNEEIGFSLVSLPTTQAPSNVDHVRYSIQAITVNSGDTIDVSVMNCRAAYTLAFLSWNQRAIAGQHTAS